jgi:hypothetical protein
MILGTKAGSLLMAWFRTNRGVAMWLAFFALACHLTFSFGHVHLSQYGSPLATPAASQTTDAAGDAPPSPLPSNKAGLSVDFCAVCANVSLAGSLLLPVLALILALGLFINVLRWPLAARAPSAFSHRPFSARGPPRACMPA